MALLRNIIIFGLTLALLGPSGFKTYHALSDHLESTCNEECQSDFTAHLHEREFHCSFDHFVLSPFQISFLDFKAEQHYTPYFKVKPLQNTIYAFHLPGGKMLRAPPAFI